MVTTIKVSDVLLALSNGETWTKKDDIGFGSIEKTYKLNPKDIAQLKAHPKLAGVETKIPSIFIFDDTEDMVTAPSKPTPSETTHGQLHEAKIEVATSQPEVVAKMQRLQDLEPEPEYQAWI